MPHRTPRKVPPAPVAVRAYPLLSADLEKLIAAPDMLFEAGFAAFVAKLEEALRDEEQWIEQLGVAPLKEHRELHAEVLRLMHHARARNLAGDYGLARKVIQLLPQWFDGRLSGASLARTQASDTSTPTVSSRATTATRSEAPVLR